MMFINEMYRRLPFSLLSLRCASSVPANIMELSPLDSARRNCILLLRNNDLLRVALVHTLAVTEQRDLCQSTIQRLPSTTPV